MRHLKFSFKGFIGAMVMALMVGFIASVATANFAIALCAAVGSMALSLIPNKSKKESGLAFMAVSVEIWQRDIEENLFKDNEFLTKSVDASSYVLAGKVVHIPQAGAKASVSKNRSVLPGTVVQRTDSDVTYSIDSYTTDPILLQDAEAAEVSYDKRRSILREHEMSLNEVIADNILITWAPSLAAQIIRTSGEVTDTHLTGTTGTRKKLTLKDIRAAQKNLDKKNISAVNRYAVISADMLEQLMEELSQTQYRDFSAAMDPAKGIVGQLYGFTIYKRSSVVTYTDAATPVINAYAAEPNTDDNDAAIFWQEMAVERAVGPTTFFENKKDPTYYGDVYSFEARVGARKRKAGQEGVVAIVQASGAGN